MSSKSTTGSANLGILRQCEQEGLDAIEAAGDVDTVVAAMRGREGNARVQEMACRRRRRRRVYQSASSFCLSVPCSLSAAVLILAKFLLTIRGCVDFNVHLLRVHFHTREFAPLRP
jgi:hypothetical protein